MLVLYYFLNNINLLYENLITYYIITLWYDKLHYIVIKQFADENDNSVFCYLNTLWNGKHWYNNIYWKLPLFSKAIWGM